MEAGASAQKLPQGPAGDAGSVAGGGRGMERSGPM